MYEKPQKLDSVTVVFRSDGVNWFSETDNNHVSKDAYRDHLCHTLKAFMKLKW